jgi:hypothetical protein
MHDETLHVSGHEITSYQKKPLIKWTRTAVRIDSLVLILGMRRETQTRSDRFGRHPYAGVLGRIPKVVCASHQLIRIDYVTSYSITC